MSFLRFPLFRKCNFFLRFSRQSSTVKLEYDSCEASAELKKDLPPVLLLHGMFDSRKSWDDIAPKIANGTGRKVYWMDARNHGDSPCTDDFDFDFMSEDIVGLMEDEKIKKAVLVGSSMGGVISMKLAVEKPHLVDKLVVEDIVPKPFLETGWKAVLVAISHMKDSLKAIPENADEKTARESISEYLKNKLPQMLPVKNQEFADRVLPLKKLNIGYVWKTNHLALEKAITLGKLDKFPSGTFTGDTLFLYGTESYMEVAEDKTILEIFPKAELVPVQGATHMIHFEEPDEFVEKVTKFINAKRQQPSSE